MTSDIHIEIDRAVFNDVYLPHLNNQARIQIFYGGSGSGKSVFLAQRAVYDLLCGQRNYLICRQVGRTIRRSVFNEIKKVITDWGLLHLFDINKSELIITCTKNRRQILFAGLDDVEKIKSITPEVGVITDVWVEEATETDKKTVKDLLKRQRGGDESVAKRMTLSFNPILQTHWIYNEYFKPLGWMDEQTEHEAHGLSILKTWYIHNRWLTEQDKSDLLSEKDVYFRNVYTFGNWGVLGNVIFTNWKIDDLSGMLDQFTNRRNGGDFGFSSHPAAIVVTHYDRQKETIYIYKELYETGLTNEVLATEAKTLISGEPITFDSAEPKSIVELQGRGVYARPALKGKDSVTFGIQWLQGQKIVVDRSCINMINELQSYKWKEDTAGNALPVPVDANNHLIDALRYAYEDDMSQKWYMA